MGEFAWPLVVLIGIGAALVGLRMALTHNKSTEDRFADCFGRIAVQANELNELRERMSKAEHRLIAVDQRTEQPFKPPVTIGRRGL